MRTLVAAGDASALQHTLRDLASDERCNPPFSASMDAAQELLLEAGQDAFALWHGSRDFATSIKAFQGHGPLNTHRGVHSGHGS